MRSLRQPTSCPLSRTSMSRRDWNESGKKKGTKTATRLNPPVEVSGKFLPFLKIAYVSGSKVNCPILMILMIILMIKIVNAVTRPNYH